MASSALSNHHRPRRGRSASSLSAAPLSDPDDSDFFPHPRHPAPQYYPRTSSSSSLRSTSPSPSERSLHHLPHRSSAAFMMSGTLLTKRNNVGGLRKRYVVLAHPIQVDEIQLVFDRVFHAASFLSKASSSVSLNHHLSRLSPEETPDILDPKVCSVYGNIAKAAVEKTPLLIILAPPSTPHPNNPSTTTSTAITPTFIHFSTVDAFYSEVDLATPCHFKLRVGQDELRFVAESSHDYQEWEEALREAIAAAEREGVKFGGLSARGLRSGSSMSMGRYGPSPTPDTSVGYDSLSRSVPRSTPTPTPSLSQTFTSPSPTPSRSFSPTPSVSMPDLYRTSSPTPPDRKKSAGLRWKASLQSLFGRRQPQPPSGLSSPYVSSGATSPAASAPASARGSVTAVGGEQPPRPSTSLGIAASTHEEHPMAQPAALHSQRSAEVLRGGIQRRDLPQHGDRPSSSLSLLDEFDGFGLGLGLGANGDSRVPAPARTVSPRSMSPRATSPTPVAQRGKETPPATGNASRETLTAISEVVAALRNESTGKPATAATKGSTQDGDSPTSSGGAGTWTEEDEEEEAATAMVVGGAMGRRGVPAATKRMAKVGSGDSATTITLGSATAAPSVAAPAQTTAEAGATRSAGVRASAASSGGGRWRDSGLGMSSTASTYSTISTVSGAAPPLPSTAGVSQRVSVGGRRSVGEGRTSMAVGEGRTSMAAGEGRPSMAMGEGRPSMAMGEGRTSMALGEGRPSMALGEGRPSMALGEGRPSMALGEGRPSMAAGESKTSPESQASPAAQAAAHVLTTQLPANVLHSKLYDQFHPASPTAPPAGLTITRTASAASSVQSTPPSAPQQLPLPSFQSATPPQRSTNKQQVRQSVASQSSTHTSASSTPSSSVRRGSRVSATGGTAPGLPPGPNAYSNPWAGRQSLDIPQTDDASARRSSMVSTTSSTYYPTTASPPPPPATNDPMAAATLAALSQQYYVAAASGAAPQQQAAAAMAYFAAAAHAASQSGDTSGAATATAYYYSHAAAAGYGSAPTSPTTGRSATPPPSGYATPGSPSVMPGYDPNVAPPPPGSTGASAYYYPHMWGGN
ncbi:hypothetical protein HDU96_000474 [Phlyctochytrium bullatum]|nr:hypothetical protein HDU96_000474 [Phlyctochytrium bullatum]